MSHIDLRFKCPSQSTVIQFDYWKTELSNCPLKTLVLLTRKTPEKSWEKLQKILGNSSRYPGPLALWGFPNKFATLFPLPGGWARELSPDQHACEQLEPEQRKLGRKMGPYQYHTNIPKTLNISNTQECWPGSSPPYQEGKYRNMCIHTYRLRVQCAQKILWVHRSLGPGFDGLWTRFGRRNRVFALVLRSSFL